MNTGGVYTPIHAYVCMNDAITVIALPDSSEGTIRTCAFVLLKKTIITFLFFTLWISHYVIKKYKSCGFTFL